MFADKKATLKELDEFIKKNEVDPGVINILNLLNKDDDYYTTSSCEGRIQLIQMDHIGDKKNSKVLGKWHSEVDKSIFSEALSVWDGKGHLYLLAQSPIFHVCCRDLQSALQLQQIASENGFRYTCIRSMRLRGADVERVTVELLTSLRLDIPIAHDGVVLPDPGHMEYLVDHCNEVMAAMKDRLATLEEVLKGVL